MKTTSAILFLIPLGMISLTGVEASGEVSVKSTANASTTASVTITRNEETGESSQAVAETSQKLALEYGIDKNVVIDLHKSGKGWGEINIMLAMATHMTGGITADNLASLSAMRYNTNGEPKKGWGVIAHELGLTVGQVVRTTGSVHQDAKMTHDVVANINIEKSSKGAKAERHLERTARALERAERMIENTQVRLERKEVQLQQRLRRELPGRINVRVD